jgi:hypothetical protein
LVVGGTATFNAASTVSNLNLSGTLSGAGDVTITGVLNWTGGTMSGTGKTIVPAGGTLNLSSGSGNSRNLNRILENNGAANWTGGSLDMNNGTFQNNGTFTANSATTLQSTGTGTNAFVNAGTFIKQGTGTVQFPFTGLGGSTIVAFNNTGNVDVQVGTLALTNPAANAGRISVAAGTTLSVSGPFTQLSFGTIEVAVTGTAAGQFGRVMVTGLATLDGKLTSIFSDGFVPVVDDSFQVITFASRVGTFATVDSRNAPTGRTVVASYGSTIVRVIVVAG